MARRILVHMGRERIFRPFIAFAALRNEFRETVWWKMLTRPESMVEVQEDLKRLRGRLDNLQGAGTVKIIFVDNCCNVRRKWTDIFPGVKVKLDTYHWLARWNCVLTDPKSDDAAQFRALMSRAIIAVGDAEFSQKKEELHEHLEREPTVKQIINACSGVCPSPAVMEQRVQM
eukprot:1955020-Ditylum_brightwellii.AAC.1